MNNRVFFALVFLALAPLSFADISMTYPVHTTLKDGASLQAGFVAPGQTFDLVFSNDSGYGYKWDNLEIVQSSIPFGWKIVSIQKTDPSLVASINVPSNALPNVYVLGVSLSDSSQPGTFEKVQPRIVVKKNLIDVSFARKSSDPFQYVGGRAVYSAKVTNSSIAPATVHIGSSLASNWFSATSVDVKPNSSKDVDLVVTSLSSGTFPFSFQASTGDDGVIVKSYSSELNVRPTLKGKFGSALSGFPFFTFTLLPFQLFDSFFSLLFP